jgi:hypothetical protein
MFIFIGCGGSQLPEVLLDEGNELTDISPPDAPQEDMEETSYAELDAVNSYSLTKAVQRAHDQLGTNPIGSKFYCLKYVRTWSGLPAKYATANDAYNNFNNKGKIVKISTPSKAPKGSFMFYSWGTTGHIGMRCDHGLIHQDNSTSGNGRIGHDTDCKFSTMTFRGYVTYANAVAYW